MQCLKRYFLRQFWVNLLGKSINSTKHKLLQVLNLFRKYFTPPLSDKDSKKNPKLSLKDRWNALKALPEYLKMVWKISPTLSFFNIVLRLITATLPSSLLYIGKIIIDIIVNQSKNPKHSTEALLWKWVLIELALALIYDLLGKLQSLLDGILGDLVSNYTSVQLMEHAGNLDLEQFEDANFYDKLERARQQTSARTVLISQILGQIQDGITLILISGVFFSYYPWLILVLLISVIPSFLSEFYFSRQTYSLGRSWTPQKRELDYLRFIGASDETAKEVKIFGLSSFLVERFKSLSSLYFLANRKLSIQRIFFGFIFSAIGSLGYYIAYLFLIIQALYGKISLGSLTFLMGSFRQMRGIMESIFSRFTSISQSALYLKDLFDFFAIEPKITSSKTSISFPKMMSIGFEFIQVGFKYPNAEKWTLQSLSFTLLPGEKLALVGENGAGKTTLVKLLARLYEPTVGEILLENIPLSHYNLEDLRINIGIIFQDFVRYQFNVSENISVGKVQEMKNKERIFKAAQQSLADSLIEQLPYKYEQILGKRFESGMELSGGGWQKIALARAYMRDAPVLILDEPTASLDAKAEYEAFGRFVELSKGKTAILISHRFSTVRFADRIMVLENGTKLELGTHEELLQNNGRYAELFHLQARGYQ